jgi:hypothetical protein
MDTAHATEAFTRMLHAIDARDWRQVRSSFDDHIDLDYSSLFGAPAARVNADEHVAGWQAFAGAFDATQHLTGPIVASPAGETVVGETHVRAYHQIRNAPGGEIWMVCGHYRFSLRRVADAWKIHAITLKVLYLEGNPAIPELARARSAQPSPEKPE